MTNETNNAYDLEERTAKFGEDIVELCKKVTLSPVTRRPVDQLIGSATSIGANYMEANGASSKKDFKNKISLCKKEAHETKYWLRILAKAAPELKGECKRLWKEVQELTLIFQSISTTLSKKKEESFGN